MDMYTLTIYCHYLESSVQLNPFLFAKTQTDKQTHKQNKNTPAFVHSHTLTDISTGTYTDDLTAEESLGTPVRDVGLESYPKNTP